MPTLLESWRTTSILSILVIMNNEYYFQQFIVLRIIILCEFDVGCRKTEILRKANLLIIKGRCFYYPQSLDLYFNKSYFDLL